MAKHKPVLPVPSKAIDPALAALFSQSAGPVKTPPKSRYSELLPQRSRSVAEEAEEEEREEEEEDSSTAEEGEASLENEEAGSSEEESSGGSGGESDGDSSSSDEDASSGEDESEPDKVPEAPISHKTSHEEGRKRKRKQRDDDDRLENDYLQRLAAEDAPSQKRRKADSEEKAAAEGVEEDTAKEDGAENIAEEDDVSPGDEVPVHESLTSDLTASEVDKANRTVFLSNVSVEAITSRKAKKALLKHLSSVLDKKADPPQKVESIRFRSTPFSTTSIPRRAAYIKKSVLEATTKSTNAYVVYSTVEAARLATAQLNGTVVLDRHLRVDSVTQPAPIDHRRCVFVGNLSFVADETVYNVKVNEEGKEVTEKRKRTKEPMDVEEGLWRVFGKEAGKVENVRVVRDPATRVGKGFAYVQFYDANAVEAAILLNGKKFPPMLARELRVSRCKAPRKAARAVDARQGKTAHSLDRKGKHDKKKKGKAHDSGKYVSKTTGEEKKHGKNPGKDEREKKRRTEDRGMKDIVKGPEEFVFEGRRASAKDGRPRDLKFKARSKDKVHKQKKKKKGVKSKNSRGALRAAKWRAQGGKK
ncbi:hypothetical protein VTK56DRAFT_2822 [Thermocarpiscus australiensis]